MPEYHPDYIHHQKAATSSVIREVIFGMEDGMVSTLGAITGIATGTSNHFTVVLAGLVIIAVESIAMGVGSFLSSKSEREIEERKLKEEKIEIRQYPDEERLELIEMYRRDGWPPELAKQMATAAEKNEKLFLQEMALRELKVIPSALENPAKNGIFMGVSYIFGGAVPLLPYLIIFDLAVATPVSVSVTLLGLFIMGVATTKFTKRRWWRAGLEMLLFASAAAGVGYAIGKLVSVLWGVTV